MACYHPIHGYRAPGGQVKFTRSGAFVDLPLTVPCGQCSGCRLERSRQWAVRCMHEAQMHEQNCFLTLTYDDEHLPTDGTLVVEHWQDFAKRLRHKLGKFRFYHCGEYGDINGRPHYHAAIFGLDFAHDRVESNKSKAGHPLYSSPTLTKLWGHGRVWIGELNFASAAYVARYIMKKQLGECAWKRYGTTIDCKPGEAGTWHTSSRFTLKPEYTTMSRRPGIGKPWFDKFHTDVYPSDQVITNGKPARPPKFYDQLLEKINQPLLRKIKSQRIQEGNKHLENNTYERLSVREEVQQARIRNLTRDL